MLGSRQTAIELLRRSAPPFETCRLASAVHSGKRNKEKRALDDLRDLAGFVAPGHGHFLHHGRFRPHLAVFGYRDRCHQADRR